MTHPTVTPLRSTWLPTNEAAELLGVSRRTIQRRARSGKIETRPGVNGSVEYRVPAGVVTPAPPMTVTPSVMPVVTPRDTPGAVEELRALLAAEQTARIDAERRAAVAEYRVEIAEVDPSEVEELRAQVALLDELQNQVATLTTERDEAREQGQALADSMRKRHQLIKRLTAQLSEARR